MSNCMGKRKVKKMASGGKPNLEAMGEKVTPPVNVKQEKKKQLRKKRYEVEKDMPAKKLADMADRARRRATGSQAKMQEMGSVTKPRTAKSKLKRRFGADTSKEDYGRKASGGSVKKMATGGTPSNEDLKSFGKGLGKSTKDMKPPKNPKRMSPERKKRIDDLIDKNVTGKSATRRIAKGGAVKKMATGGKVKGRRGDGICSRGRTKGRMV